MYREYIERDELLIKINENPAEQANERCVQLIEAILEAPAINPEDCRPHGRWIPIPEHENKRCSVCKIVFSDFTLGYYCPHCGAKMDGKEQGDELS